MRNYLESFLNRKTLVQFFRLGLIGGLNTVFFFVLLNVFRWVVGLTSFWSVTFAFAIATGMSYLLNRRWTFQIKEGYGSARESATFYVVNLIAWAVTAGLVQLAERLIGPLGPLELNAVSLLATGIILLPKFASYRDVVFRRSLESTDRS
jgi:putative flippase GtrA